MDFAHCFHSYKNFCRKTTYFAGQPCTSAVLYPPTQLQSCITNKPSLCKEHERLHSHLFCSPRHKINIASRKAVLSAEGTIRGFGKHWPAPDAPQAQRMPVVGSQGWGIRLCPRDEGHQTWRGKGKAGQPPAGLPTCPRAICKLTFQQQKDKENKHHKETHIQPREM